MADKPSRRGAIALLMLCLLLVAGCGSGPNQINEAPPIPPTATRQPGPDARGELSGPLLVPLEDGREVTAASGRFTLNVPADWQQVGDADAELSFRDTGGDTTFRITSEPLQANATGVEEWAATVQASQEDVETISFEPVQVGRRQAVRWIARDNDDDLMVYQVFILDGRNGITLTGTAPDDKSEIAFDLFDAVAGSLSLPRG